MRQRTAFALEKDRTAGGLPLVTLRNRTLWAARIIWWALVAGRVVAETLTIATYNIENYVATDRLVEGIYREDYPKPETSKQALRKVISELNADILALQEMGPRPYLEELRADLAREGLNYPYSELVEGRDVDRHVAVLSKRPFKEVHAQTELSFKYFGAPETVKRGILEVRFGEELQGLTLFIVHLKSRITEQANDPDSAVRRAGEATAVRDYILNRFPEPADARFLILGDFNDARSSKAVRFLTKRGKTEIARLLPAKDSRGETWTHWYRKEDSYSRIDHILASEGICSAIVGDGARIYDHPEWQEASDHRPVVVVLDTKKAAK